MLASVRHFLTRGRGLYLVPLLALLVLNLVWSSSAAHAADPTSAADMFTAMSAIFTAFPILTIILTAVAIAGVAMYVLKRGKSVAR